MAGWGQPPVGPGENRTVMRYLSSRANVVGSLAALATLGLHVALVAAGTSGLGFLWPVAVAGERVRTRGSSMAARTGCRLLQDPSMSRSASAACACSGTWTMR